MRLNKVLLAILCSVYGTAMATGVVDNTEKKASKISLKPQKAIESDRYQLDSDPRFYKLEDMLNQNKGGIIQNDPSLAHVWFQHFILSAKANVDGGIANRTPSSNEGSFGRYNNGRSGDIALSNVLFYADAWATEWLTGHAALLYSNYHGIYQLYDQDNGLTATPLIFDRPNDPAFHSFTNTHFSRERLLLDEAYIRISNLRRTPFFFEGGRFYVPFGNYELHPLVESLPQRLSQTQGNAVELGGAIPLGPKNGGLTALAYGLQGTQEIAVYRQNKRGNFGAQVAYGQETEVCGYTVDVGYLYNLGATDFLATSPGNIYHYPQTTKKVGGIATDALGHVGPFDGHLNFVSSLGQFKPIDEAYRGHGAAPKAVDVGGGFSFNTFNLNSRIGLGYQRSWQAARLGLGAVLRGAGLPQQRIQGDYTINVSRYANVQFLVHYDDDYSFKNGGTNRNSVTGLLRLTLGVA